MANVFPRTNVGGVSLPRMLMGTNWLMGYSHRSYAADLGIRERYSSPEAFFPVIEEYMKYGIDAIMGPISGDAIATEAVHYAEDKLGKKIIIIDTPWMNVDDTPEARAEAEQVIKHSAEIGSTFCLVHHGCAEQLVNKNKRTMDRLPDYLSMIRDAGMVPGLSAHMPELILYSDANEYDVETYIQIFNCMGFLMQIEIESVARIIQNAKKPVMTIKPFAAGRCTPFVGLTFNWNVIRECDMITVGASTPYEVKEDVELSFEILEHRFPNIAARSSPAKQEILGHK